MVAEGGGNTSFVIALGIQLFDIAVVFGNGNDLQGGGFLLAQNIPADLINGTEAALF